MSDSPASLNRKTGLGEAEAQARLRTDGYNELPRPDRRTQFKIVLEVLREPMLALLFAGGVVYLALGDWREALVLLVFATLAIAITVIQETRTEHVLEALRDLTSPRALVIRDGERKRIPGREVARGDLLVLAEGDRVPADAKILECEDLLVDESLLTGESVPVRKTPATEFDAARSRRPGGEDAPCVFAGSLVVRGGGLAEAIATGAMSEIGKIGHSLNVLDTEPPRLHAQVNRLVWMSALVGGAVTLLAVALYVLTRGHWLEAILGGITLGMSMLPQEFTVVLTVFMAMGAWRISRARVLTRRASAIEALGSATVLCTDKTGTLTENRMSIAELRRRDGQAFRLDNSPGANVPAPFRDLVEAGVLASAREPFDPMEKALHNLRRDSVPETGRLDTRIWSLVHVYGLRPDLLAVSQIWKTDESEPGFVVFCKGAPEALAELCRLSSDERAALKNSVEEMAAEGLRILGVARASFDGERPASPREFAFEFLRTRRTGRSAAAQRAQRGEGMPIGGHSSCHDHRRLPEYRRCDRPACWPRCAARGDWRSA